MSERGQNTPSERSTSINGRSINRRHFMEGTAWLGVAAGLNTSLAGPAIGATRNGDNASSSDSRLPDGSEFPFWEQPLTFSKTYYVDNNASNADDNGPGDRARPFRTIGKAAEVLRPGERVVIASGVYRECVRPARGGESPSRMISYEAAPGAKVYIKGSDVLKDGWQRETAQYRPRGSAAAPTEATVWRYQLTSAMFPDLYNPFALPSIARSWAWLNTAKADMGSYLRRRGLVFADGKPLEPMEQLAELAMPDLPPEPDYTVPPQSEFGMPPRRRGGPIMQEIGGSPTARFWTEHSGTAIYVRLESGTPAEHLIEATMREHAFIPVSSGISFIRIKGITFQHVGNAYPDPGSQSGMISPAGGDHWIIEDNTMEWANGMALDLGRGAYSDGAPSPGDSQIVRRNTVRYSGVAGIAGIPTSNTLIEDNLVEWCGWADAQWSWEAAGVKFHRAKNMLFRRNVVRHMRHAAGGWWDVDNVNCRITRNVFADVHTMDAAINMEMNGDQNCIDNNIIWGVQNGEPGTLGHRGAAGSAIWDNATSNLIVAHNLIGPSNNAGVFAIVRPDRGMPVADSNTVSNNIFVKCGRSAVNFLNENNEADGNVYVGLPEKFNGLFQGEPTPEYDPDAWTHIKLHDLPSWRGIKGWGENSIMADAEIDFDPATLQLTISSNTPIPRVPLINGINTDYFGTATGSTRIAGPLAEIAEMGAKRSWNADPRILSQS